MHFKYKYIYESIQCEFIDELQLQAAIHPAAKISARRHIDEQA